jgi:stearoyl-CoA desaturase (delta-9 desaturase)
MSTFREVDWKVAICLALMHLLVVPAFFFCSWPAVLTCLFLVWLTGSVGIGIGFHRLLTHASFKTYRWVKYVFTICGVLSWQGSVFSWVGDHRIHHGHSDHDGDPHSPRHGFLRSHVFWLLFKALPGRDRLKYTKDLQRDRGLVLLDRYFWLPQIVLAVTLAVVGAWYGGVVEAIALVAWGIGVRTTFVYHVTWAVNSVCHTFGYRNYQDTGDDSRNFWPVGLLAFGEGWHNNHHAQPRSAAHGHRGWEFDLNYWIIKSLSLVGLTWDIKMPKAKLI